MCKGGSSSPRRLQLRSGRRWLCCKPAISQSDANQYWTLDVVVVEVCEVITNVLWLQNGWFSYHLYQYPDWEQSQSANTGICKHSFPIHTVIVLQRLLWTHQCEWVWPLRMAYLTRRQIQLLLCYQIGVCIVCLQVSILVNCYTDPWPPCLWPIAASALPE